MNYRTSIAERIFTDSGDLIPEAAMLHPIDFDEITRQPAYLSNGEQVVRIFLQRKHFLWKLALRVPNIEIDWLQVVLADEIPFPWVSLLSEVDLVATEFHQRLVIDRQIQHVAGWDNDKLYRTEPEKKEIYSFAEKSLDKVEPVVYSKNISSNRD